MKKQLVLGIVALMAGSARCHAQTAPATPDWVEHSNRYAQKLIEIQKKHGPEGASAQGLAEYDTQISQPTRKDEQEAIAETKAVLSEFQSALGKESDPFVRQDLEIMIRRSELYLKQQAYADAHNVTYRNASAFVFQGVRGLLDDQVAAERRNAAVVRLRKYAGLEPGYRPLADILKERTQEQIAKTGVLYPAKVEVETSLARNPSFIDGIAALCKHYQLAGWEEPFAKVKTQLADYDGWITKEILPKARSDFREPPEEYALDLEAFGIDLPPAKLAEMAHQSFTEIQGEMQSISRQIAKKNNWPSGDYRNVIKKLKEKQLVGETILPFYQQRLKDIEEIIVAQNLVALPKRPARIRIGTPAESAQQPAPHMTPPPFLNNKGEQGEFVLPLNMPAVSGSSKSEKVDDYTFDAAAWTLTAHEARPGHELQFDSMIEHGVSIARARYAFNSTNVEGWGLYAEYITKPYMPLEGQLISLQFRLLRAARAYLDPELQAGKLQPPDAMRVLTDDCVFSAPFANQEVERYTFRMPGQAGSYFYGYTKLISLRQDVEAALGSKFDQKKYHDFLLAQGLLPPALLRQAVMEQFVPSQRTN
jgi:Uncharacterized protein conserved in bacteria